MARPANLRRTLWAASVPLILSLLVHGSLFLVLSLWPARGHGLAGVVSSTRISLETCMFDLGSPAVQEAPLIPADLAGPNVTTAMEPRLLDPPPVPAETSTPPAGGSGAPAALSSNPPAGSGEPSSEGHGSGGGNLFPLPSSASSVVYVLDRSVSMGERDKLERACRELLASLRQLPRTAKFQILYYSDYAMPLVINNRTDLLEAEPANIGAAARVLATLTPSGKTNHAAALRSGLSLRADVLYFITDADDLLYEQIKEVTLENSVTAIHIVELTGRRAAPPDNPLARLARAKGGTYRRVPIGE